MFYGMAKGGNCARGGDVIGAKIDVYFIVLCDSAHVKI